MPDNKAALDSPRQFPTSKCNSTNLTAHSLALMDLQKLGLLVELQGQQQRREFQRQVELERPVHNQTAKERIARFLSTYSQEPKPSILVIGDVMLDQCFYGDVSREPLAHQTHGLSVMYEADKGFFQPGGAAYFVSFLSTRFDVHLIGVTGEDNAGDFLEQIMAPYCKFYRIRDRERPTTLKIRFFQWHPAMKTFVEGTFRLDWETRQPISSPMENIICNHIREMRRDLKGTFIHDFGKGVVTPQVVQTVRDSFPSIPLFVDPKFDPDPFRTIPIDYLLPNEQEANLWAGNHVETSGTEALELSTLAEVLIDKYPLIRCFSVKLGERGSMVLDRGALMDPNVQAVRIPPIKLESVHSTWGAGDVYDCYFTAAVLSAFDSIQAAQIANTAAGLHVSSADPNLPSAISVLEELKNFPRRENLGTVTSKSEKIFRDALKHLGEPLRLNAAFPLVPEVVSPKGSKYYDHFKEILEIMETAEGTKVLLNAPSGWGKSTLLQKAAAYLGISSAFLNTPAILNDLQKWQDKLSTASTASVIVLDEFDRDIQASRFIKMFEANRIEAQNPVELMNKRLIAITSTPLDHLDRQFPDLRSRFDKQIVVAPIKGDCLYIAYAICFYLSKATVPRPSHITVAALRDLMLYSYENRIEGRFNNRELKSLVNEIATTVRTRGGTIIDRAVLPERVMTHVPCGDDKIEIIYA